MTTIKEVLLPAAKSDLEKKAIETISEMNVVDALDFVTRILVVAMVDMNADKFCMSLSDSTTRYAVTIKKEEGKS